MLRVGVAFLLASVSWAAQVPFIQNLDSFPAPEQDLRALSIEQFTAFSHPAFPKHSVRIKQLKDLCDNKSKYVYLHSWDVHSSSNARIFVQVVLGVHQRRGATPLLLLLREPEQP